MQQNAGAYVPRVDLRAGVAHDIRSIFNAPDRLLAKAVKAWQKPAPRYGRMVLPALLAFLTLIQDPEPIPSSPYDRVVELEITAADEPAIEGLGPTVYGEYEVDGTLQIWTTATRPYDGTLRENGA